MNISKNKWLVGVVSIFTCASTQGAEPTIELSCGTSNLNGAIIQKQCLQNDYIAKKITYDESGPISRFFANVVSGGHGYLAGSHSSGTAGLSNGYTETELDMQGHVWDFSKQNSPGVFISGNDSVITNGVILYGNVNLGATYFTPNFAKSSQINNLNIIPSSRTDRPHYGFLYADNYYSCKEVSRLNCEGEPKEKFNLRENIFLKNMKIQGDNINFSSWGGGVHSSQLVIKNNIYINGSKATILNNQIWSNLELANNKQLFALQANNQSKLVDKSAQIFPDRWDDKIAIPSILYVKFSPDTVIDGNTFTLTHKNDQAYAIVLDHSPRVRITNNTFNGFKVPILMDQWSSIVDDKGNVMNPNQFAGDVEMNRKGVIVKK